MYEENTLVGKVLNERYEILEVVGSGGMATVYKAECKLLNRYVAVKVLKDSLRYDLDLKEKFNREAQAAAKLSHNNIVSIFDVGEIDGLNYIVMELIEGTTLKEYITQNKPIHWKVARNIAIQIGMALEHAHANGIIHRDIKPHNILITKDNVIKVADFGIASAVSTETVVAGKNDGAAMGSVHYISPEQARGGYITETTDIYSLGVIMYEMLTGQLPFDGDNAVSIAMMKLEQEPVNCKVVNLDVPADMAEIVMRALAKDPAQRFSTVQEMIVSLRKLGTQNQAPGAVIRTAEERQEIIKKKKEKSEKTNNNKMIINIIISMLVVIGIVGVGTALYLNGWNVKEVQVPDLLDKTLEEAITIAEEHDLRIDEKKIEYEISEEFEEGKIMEQKPGANTFVKKNKKISLVISKGKTEGDIELISVLGMQYDEAVKKLEDMGLRTEKIEREDEKAELGEVVAQSPADGEKVSENAVITLYVCTSKPEEHKEIPGVIGMNKSQAEATLKAAGFSLGNVKKENSNKPVGEIIDQDPTAGSESPQGTYVNIVISAGKAEEVTPPENSTPEANNPGTPNTPNTPEEEVKPQIKTITIPLPEDGDEIIHVKVLANGKEFYNKKHPKTDGKVDVRVQAKKDTNIQVYFGDTLVVEKVIEFN